MWWIHDGSFELVYTIIILMALAWNIVLKPGHENAEWKQFCLHIKEYDRFEFGVDATKWRRMGVNYLF